MIFESGFFCILKNELYIHKMNKKVWVTGASIAVLIIIYFLLKSPLANKYNEAGIETFNTGNYDEAGKNFKMALFWKHKSSTALINMVKVELAQENFEKTDLYMQKLLKYYPEHAETFGLEGQLLVKRKQFENAMISLDQAIEKDSSLAYAYYYRGIAKANMNDLAGAAEDYLTAQKLDIDNIEALEERAVVLTKLEDFNALIENYDALIALDPSNTSAFLERGNFKMKIADYENAIADFSQAILLNDKLGEAYFNRGISYAKMEKFGEAQMDFDRAAKLNYKKSGAFYNAGMASVKLGKTTDAKTYLNKVLQQKETDEYKANSNYLLGIINMMEGKNSEAVNYLNKAIEIDANYTDAYYNRGIAYGLLEKHIEALSDLEKCLKLGKKTADLYFAMGVQRIALNNFPAGCSDLKTAAEMGSDQAEQMRIQYCKQY